MVLTQSKIKVCLHISKNNTILPPKMIKNSRSHRGARKATRREPKTGLGRVFNYKLGCSENVHVIMDTDAHLYL
jgi:hypothetical protein